MKYPFMPLFLGDLLADTLHLSTQEFGAYVLLILHAWKHDGIIDEQNARQVARVAYKYWPKVWANLRPFFEIQECGKDFPTRLVHMRVSKQLSYAAEISNKRKDAAVQMHAKRRANASHPQSQSCRESSNCEEGRGQPPQPNGPPDIPPQPAKKQNNGMSPEQGNDYRSPPRSKSDNVLHPMPDKAADTRSQPPKPPPME